jgi:hypothetical protein
MDRGMLATAWKNGSPDARGNGYGLKISAADRDAFLKREFGSITLHLPGISRPVTVNIDKASMWEGTCRELISRDIGAWLIGVGLAPWPKGAPPKFRLVPRGERAFDVLPASPQTATLPFLPMPASAGQPSRPGSRPLIPGP